MNDETEVCWNCKHYDKATRYCATVDMKMMSHEWAKTYKPRFIRTGPCTEWVARSEKTVYYQVRTYTPEMGSMREPDNFSTLKAAKEKAKSLIGQETQIIKITEEIVK